jgi:hypothetical protein
MNEETKQKISEANKGNEKLIESHKGKTLSEEHKKKIGESVEGMEMPEEAKQKISESQTGATNSQSKLNKEAVKVIKWKHEHTNSTYNELAEAYNVSVSTIGEICREETWSHVSIS